MLEPRPIGPPADAPVALAVHAVSSVRIRRLLGCGGIREAHHVLGAGTRIEPHLHPHPQFILVDAGMGRIEIAGTVLAARPGMLVEVAANHPHGVQCDTDAASTVIDIPPS